MLIVTTVIFGLYSICDSFGICDPNPCLNGGSCIPIDQLSTQTKGSYQCLCIPGWTGENCTLRVTGCGDGPCLNGGHCEEEPGLRYTCHCPKEFVGLNCEYQNPCEADNPCENSGRCEANALGEFQCICSKWYQGTRCEHVRNPCFPDNPCTGPGSQCSIQHEIDPEGNGSLIVDFNCSCSPGYTGRFCDVLFNRCTEDSCQNGGICTIQGSEAICICPKGFDGANCENAIERINQSWSSKIQSHPDNSRCQSLSCPSETFGDGVCHSECLLNGCGSSEEGNDCESWAKCLESLLNEGHRIGCAERFQNGQCDALCNRPECHYDGFDCDIPDYSQCADADYCKTVHADGICQEICASDACGYDGGDCHLAEPFESQLIEYNTMPSNMKLNILLLNTSSAAFQANRKLLLASLSKLVNALVVVWKDPETKRELLTELPDHQGFGVVIATLTNLTACANSTCPGGMIHALNATQLADYLHAASVTSKERQPLALKQVMPVTDRRQLDYLKLLQRTSEELLRPSELKALYACLCLLGAIIFILVVCMVLQPWSKSKRKVRTNGIWCPPIPVNVKADNQPILYANPRCDIPWPMKWPPGAIGCLGLEDFGQRTEESYDCASLLSDSVSRTPIPQVRPAEIPLKRTRELINTRVAEGEVSSPDTPLCKYTKYERTSPLQRNLDQPYINAVNFLFGSTSAYLDHAAYQASREEHHKFTSFTSDAEASQMSREVQEEAPLVRKIRYILKSKDGIHPDADELTSLLQRYPNAILPTTDIVVPDAAEAAPIDTSFGSNLKAYEDNTIVGASPDEPLLHMAGRYNAGQDVIFSLAHLYNCDMDPKVILNADHTTRTALACAAASNAFDSVGALYQIERDAVANLKSTLPPRTLGLESTRTRRRQKQAEPRRSTALISAVQGGNEEMARYLIDEGYPLHGIDEYGRNVVHWAAATNAVSTLQRLAQSKGFPRLVNARDDNDRTPLMLATREGCYEAVCLLLDNKANVLNGHTSESGPIRIARDKGFTDIENLLRSHQSVKVTESSFKSEDLCSNEHELVLSVGDTQSSMSDLSGSDVFSEGSAEEIGGNRSSYHPH